MNSQHYFDTIAMEWNHYRQAYFKEDIRPLLFDTVDFTDKIAIDLGAGTGFLALEMAKRAKLVVAVDQSRNMLEELEQKARNLQLTNILNLQSPMDQVGLLDQQADIVTINMALHHAEHPDQAIKEFYRLLKPGGQLIISDVMEHTGTWAHAEMHDIWLGFSLQQIQRWMEEAGFEQISVTNTQLVATATSQKQERLQTTILIASGQRGETI